LKETVLLLKSSYDFVRLNWFSLKGVYFEMGNEQTRELSLEERKLREIAEMDWEVKQKLALKGPKFNSENFYLLFPFGSFFQDLLIL
jgi:hypothetical protein